MKREELEKILNEENFELDMFDEMNGITIEDKKRFKIEEIIENNVNCPNCNEITLTGCNPMVNEFVCTKCENTFFEDDLIIE